MRALLMLTHSPTDSHADSHTLSGMVDRQAHAECYACLSCAFVGVREVESEGGAGDSGGGGARSFMAHAILRGHSFGATV